MNFIIIGNFLMCFVMLRSFCEVGRSNFFVILYVDLERWYEEIRVDLR